MAANPVLSAQDGTADTLHRPVHQDVGAAELGDTSAPDKALAMGTSTNEVLTAQALLAGRPWVGIEHNGQHYRLQTTRAGKLILTK